MSAWYRFDAEPGTSWYAFQSSNPRGPGSLLSQIELISKTEVVTTDLGVFYDCYKFHIWAVDYSSGGYYDWIAKGVGLVKRTHLGHESSDVDSHELPGYILKSYELGPVK